MAVWQCVAVSRFCGREGERSGVLPLMCAATAGGGVGDDAATIDSPEVVVQRLVNRGVYVQNGGCGTIAVAALWGWLAVLQTGEK